MRNRVKRLQRALAKLGAADELTSGIDTLGFCRANKFCALVDTFIAFDQRRCAAGFYFQQC